VPIVRPTFRLLGNIGIPVPLISVDVGTIEHGMLDKARGLASSYPQNLINIRDITDTQVYRYTWGRFRVCTWLDRDLDVLWVLSADLRTGDTYDEWIELHATGVLLPLAEDYRRWQLESDLRMGKEILQTVPGWLEDVRANPNSERKQKLTNGAEVFLFSRTINGTEEIWVAMPQSTVQPPVVSLTPQLRRLIVAVMLGAAPGSIWEEDRHDFPSRKLRDYETACLGLVP
jgi:hypothetical protein